MAWASTGRRAGVFLQALENERVELGRHRGVERARRRWRLAQVLQEKGRDVTRHEGQPPHGAAKEDATHGVEVGGGARLRGGDALRGHVLRRAEDLARGREARVVHRPGDAKVKNLEQLRAVLQGDDEEVVGLEVAVEHLEVVGAREARGELEPEVDGATNLQGPAVAPQDGLERLAFEVLHHQEGRAVVEGALVDNLHHVAVREASGAAGLAAKSLAELGVARELLAEELDGHRALVQRRKGAVHRGHAPRADHPLDAVPARDDGAHEGVLLDDEGHPVYEAHRRLRRMPEPTRGADLCPC
jgi:hypothetical protein